MSNTGRKKKLASFNCDEDLWAGFMRRCQEKGTTATATLTRFISLYLDGSLDNLDAYLGKAGEITLGADTLDLRSFEQVKARVNEYLEKCLPSYLDNYLATSQGNQISLPNTVVAKTTPSNSTKKTRNNTNSSNSTQQREFWFIQERAKHLGLKINANHLIHIELFANDSYKQRHGKLPNRQLFRRSQAFAYPVADVDLLDAAIKGVVARG